MHSFWKGRRFLRSKYASFLRCLFFALLAFTASNSYGLFQIDGCKGCYADTVERYRHDIDQCDWLDYVPLGSLFRGRCRVQAVDNLIANYVQCRIDWENCPNANNGTW